MTGAVNVQIQGGTHKFHEQSALQITESTRFINTNIEWQDNASVEIAAGRTLRFEQSTLELDGLLRKTGSGGLKLDRLVLLDNASYSGSTTTDTSYL